jgi:hypothetical protein
VAAIWIPVAGAGRRATAQEDLDQGAGHGEVSEAAQPLKEDGL